MNAKIGIRSTILCFNTVLGYWTPRSLSLFLNLFVCAFVYFIFLLYVTFKLVTFKIFCPYSVGD
jgi:hypothetical protein